MPVGLGVVPDCAAELPSLCKKQVSWSLKLGGTIGQSQLCSSGKPVIPVGRDGKQDTATLFLASNPQYFYHICTCSFPIHSEILSQKCVGGPHLVWQLFANGHS